jgi:hypothetical protein
MLPWNGKRPHVKLSIRNELLELLATRGGHRLGGKLAARLLPHASSDPAPGECEEQSSPIGRRKIMQPSLVVVCILFVLFGAIISRRSRTSSKDKTAGGFQPTQSTVI